MRDFDQNGYGEYEVIGQNGEECFMHFEGLVVMSGGLLLEAKCNV